MRGLWWIDGDRLVPILLSLALFWGCEKAPGTQTGPDLLPDPSPDASSSDAVADAPVVAHECETDADCPAVAGVDADCTRATCTAERRCLPAPRPDQTVCTPDDVCALAGRCETGTCVATARRKVCPCPELSCARSEKPADSDEDGCPDTCVVPCSLASDCGASGKVPSCPENDQLEAQWTCSGGVCTAQCVAPAACKPGANSCAISEYCAADTCASGGQCEPVPAACPEPTGQPVCGCDGLTYSGACEAAQARVTVAHTGACACDGCPDSGYCSRPDGLCGDEGVCLPRPASCTSGGSTVCGCDGVTYATDCARQVAGVSVGGAETCGCKAITCAAGSAPTNVEGDACPDGCVACPSFTCLAGSQPVDGDGDGCVDACEATACSDGAECPSGSVCARTACNSVGHCVPAPDACSELSLPVCACDKTTTYNNACEALFAGQGIASAGACAVECGVGKPACPDGLMCDLTGSCGATEGECRSPKTCAAGPVCGCDGQTWPSDCARLASGIAKDHSGSCDCPPLECAPGTSPQGGVAPELCPTSCAAVPCDAATPCGPGLFCQTIGCNGVGVCSPTPATCDNSAGAPVCGCSGATFDNPCRAAQAGVSVSHTGPCPVACGPDLPCPLTDVCSAACGESGTCKPRPASCAKVVAAPVCGCDGRTYLHDCARESAGVGRLHPGSCACGDPDQECKSGQMCARVACGGPGTCIEKPFACAPGDPVCGCDGQTYAGGCSAMAAGTSVGPCATEPCQVDGDDCPGGSWCEPTACGAKTGECVHTGSLCPGGAEAVCGCDDKTYPNDCVRRQAHAGKRSGGACECPPVECPGTLVGVDLDADGCADGCDVCEVIACSSGMTPADTDADGCFDTCVSACVKVPFCAPGRVAIDSDLDGCLDQCRLPCDATCDCYAAAGPPGTVCPLACANCVSAWSCKAGTCEAGCGPMPAEALACCVLPKCELGAEDTNADGCPDRCLCGAPPVCTGARILADDDDDGCLESCACPVPPECAPGRVARDVDGDGCNDTCACVSSVSCELPRTAVDDDDNGCADRCECPKFGCGIGLVPVDSGSGCPDLCVCSSTSQCQPGQTPIDANGDGCVESCECPTAPKCDADSEPTDPTNLGCKTTCTCKALTCSVGRVREDTDSNGCADACVCGAAPVCPAPRKQADTNEDGCADACLCPGLPVCKAPRSLEDVNNDGCFDTCSCPALVCGDGRVAVDLDGDGCGDLCACPTPPKCETTLVLYDDDRNGCPEVCACPSLACEPGTYAKDSDANGCADTCLTCAAFTCQNGQTAVDTSGDGCADKCVTCTTLQCGTPKVAADTNHDGCADTCVPATCQTNDVCGSAAICGRAPKACSAVGKCVVPPASCPNAPFAERVCGCDGTTYASSCEASRAGRSVASAGPCCKAITCPSGATPKDATGDGCADVCVCSSGSLATSTGCPTACSVTAACPKGASQDLTGDGCADACGCKGDVVLTPAGCGGPKCEAPFTCSGDLPSHAWLVDTDGDGCYDLVDACPDGTHGVDLVGDGCHSGCVPDL